MHHRKVLKKIYLTAFIMTLHAALISYVNSSFLATKLPENLIGGLYIASAILAVMGLFIVPRLINAFGTQKTLGGLILVSIGGLIGMMIAPQLIIVAVCFALYFAASICIYLGIDILLEHWSENTIQGTIRGIYLTLTSMAFMISPLISGFILDRLGFGVLYGLSTALLIPVGILLITKIPPITHTHASKSNILGLAKKFLNHKNFSAVFFVNFTLQFFYAWMVIYVPIYLHQHVGLPWDTIGLTFTIMLSAFVLFEYGFGRIADRFHAEKWMMFVGLIIMGLTSILVTRAPLVGFWGLAMILFVSRIGASFVEVATESYFFKQVKHADTGSIGFFRNTYPFAYIIAPLIGSVIISFAPLWTLFIILGIICFLTLAVATQIEPIRP